MNLKTRASVGPVISGVLSGLVVAVYFSLNSPNEDPHENTSVVLPAETKTLITTDQETQNLARSNESKILDVQSQLDELKRQASTNKSAQQANPPESPQDESAIYDEQTPEEAMTDEYAWWDNLKIQVELENYDSTWAPTAESNFQHDFVSLATEGEFTLVNTDCRTTRCAVTVEFPSYTVATENFSKLLHHQYQTNCARHTMLPKPDRAQGESSYQATFIFECNDSNSAS